MLFFFFFSSRRRHTRYWRDWSSDVCSSDLDQAAKVHQGEGFDGFNLSDIFEYLDEPTSMEVYARLLDVARPGARFAYWNMLVPRRLSKSFPRDRYLEAESKALFAKDLAWFY